MRTVSRPSRLTRDQRKAQTRERLLATATEILLHRGFHAATLEQIALEAGLTKGAVYSNFASKADLFLAVVDARAQERAPRLSRARERATSLEDLARRHARAAIADDPDGRWASVLVEAWAAAGDDEQFRAALLDFQRLRLARALRHAAAASPYYRQAIGTAIADGASLADLPVLTKRELMDNWDRIVTDPTGDARHPRCQSAGHDAV